MSMRRRSATRGNVHINDAEAAIGLLAGHRDGVSIADQTDANKLVVSIPTAPTIHLPDGWTLNENPRRQKGAD